MTWYRDSNLFWMIGQPKNGLGKTNVSFWCPCDLSPLRKGHSLYTQSGSILIAFDRRWVWLSCWSEGPGGPLPSSQLGGSQPSWSGPASPSLNRLHDTQWATSPVCKMPWPRRYLCSNQPSIKLHRTSLYPWSLIISFAEKKALSESWVAGQPHLPRGDSAQSIYFHVVFLLWFDSVLKDHAIPLFHIWEKCLKCYLFCFFFVCVCPARRPIFPQTQTTVMRLRHWRLMCSVVV